jgi:hypothetical protein
MCLDGKYANGTRALLKRVSQLTQCGATTVLCGADLTGRCAGNWPTLRSRQGRQESRMRRFWSLRMCSAAVTQLCAYLREMREVEGAWRLGLTVTSRSTCVSGTESVEASTLCYRSLSSTVHSCCVAELYIRSRRQRLRNCVMPFRSAQTREVSASSPSSYLRRHQCFLGSGRARWSVTAPFRVALLCCRNSDTCLRSIF